MNWKGEGPSRQQVFVSLAGFCLTGALDPTSVRRRNQNSIPTPKDQRKVP